MMKGCRDLARLRIEAINKNSLFREEQAVRNYCAGM